MKTLIPFVLSLLAAVASQNCQAASAWLIVARSGHHELMYGNGSGLRSVLQLGDRTVYGTSKKKSEWCRATHFRVALRCSS